MLPVLMMLGCSGVARAGLMAPPEEREVEVMEGEGDYVVVVHGWAWLREAMLPTSRHLNDQGYRIISVFYDPKVEMPADVAERRIVPAIATHCTDPARKIHFVGHSMGCLTIRAYLEKHRPSALGRVVLLAPPNHGIELVDRMKDWRLFIRIFGEPARHLGTGPEAIAGRLGPADYPLGIIMGRDIGLPVLSAILPGPDDGIVAVESGRLDGMRDFITVRCIHMTLPGDRTVLRQTAAFLRNGEFERDGEPSALGPRRKAGYPHRKRAGR